MNKAKNVFRRLTASVLTLAITAAFCISPAWARATDFFDTFPPEIPADALKVVKPDDSAFNAALDAYNKALDEKAPADKVSELFSELNAQFNLIVVHSVAAYVSYYAHPTKYEKEYTAWSALVTKSDSAYTLAIQAGLTSDYADAITEILGEKSAESYKNASSDTPEQLALLEKCTALQTDYWKGRDSSYTYNIDGRDWTDSEADAAYSNGTLSYDDYIRIIIGTAKQKNAVTGEIYAKLIKLRNEYAVSKGYANYAEYAYPNFFMRDYTPEDSQRFCDMIKKALPAISRKLQTIPHYNPNVGKTVIPSLAGITSERCIELVKGLIPAVSDEYAEVFDYMLRNRLYDLEFSDEKLDRGFSITLDPYKSAYMYNMPYGDHRDLDALIHEFGHYAQMCLAPAPRTCYDCSETNSQGLEMLYLSFADDFAGEDGDAYRWWNISSFINIIAAYSALDEFERAAYTDGNLSVNELNRLYRSIAEQYGLSFVSNDGMAYSWVDTPHIFETPFYVISYVTSMLTSLELLERSQTDFDAAADAYLEFTSGTSDHSYCELIEESGLSDVFSEGAAERILNSALDYLEIEAANGVDFKDTDGHWFEGGAQTLSACGIVKGSDGYFEPEAAATRAMLAAEMYRMSGSHALEDAPVLLDVSESDWYCAPARWAAQAGFLPAEDGKFNPDAAITREELAQAIMLACGGDGTSVDKTMLDKFTDVSEISEDARAAFAWAVNYGIILGSGDKLEPAAKATRAEVGQILMRIL